MGVSVANLVNEISKVRAQIAETEAKLAQQNSRTVFGLFDLLLCLATFSFWLIVVFFRWLDKGGKQKKYRNQITKLTYRLSQLEAQRQEELQSELLAKQAAMQARK